MNLAKTKLAGAQVMEKSAEAAITILTHENRRFNIIFLDPPYDSPLLAQTLQLLPPLLAENGVIIAETENVTAPEIPGLALTSTRTYGRTTFLFYEAIT
jgi:16S rRNA (guanine966-N2)-methyltransferase